MLQCSRGSVVEHCVSSAKVVGSIPREHILTKMYGLNKSLWIKASAKCINVNIYILVIKKKKKLQNLLFYILQLLLLFIIIQDLDFTLTNLLQFQKHTS